MKLILVADHVIFFKSSYSLEKVAQSVRNHQVKRPMRVSREAQAAPAYAICNRGQPMVTY